MRCSMVNRALLELSFSVTNNSLFDSVGVQRYKRLSL